MKGYDSNITIKIPNDKDVKVNISTESKSHIIWTSDIKTKSSTELIKESVNEMDTLRIIKKYIDNGWMSRLDFISSLNESINKGYFVISELLINSSLDVVSYKDKENHTFLHSAFLKKNLGLCKLLIQRGADVNAKDRRGWSPLHWAVHKDFVDIAKLLISTGADVNAKDILGQSPLHYAISEGNVALAELLISAGAYVDAKLKNNVTPLVLAFSKDNVSIAKSLIEAGANIDVTIDGINQTLLEYAIQRNKVELAELLISTGVNISFKNKDGYTPLHLCAMKDNLELFISLLERGADPELKSDCGNNCLHLAVLNNSQNIVYRILKYHNMDINAKNSNGYSPIKLAKNEFIYNLLIESGAYDEIKKNIKKSTYQLKLMNILICIMIICFSISIFIKENRYTKGIDFFGTLGLTCFMLLIILSCSKSDWIMKFIDFKKSMSFK